MARYKLWLKIKYKDGTEKEVDGGEIDFGLSDEDKSAIVIGAVEELENRGYVTDAELTTAVNNAISQNISSAVSNVLSTDANVQEIVTTVVENNIDTINYNPFVNNENN